MIRRRQRDTFLFALLLMTRAAYVRSLSQYEIQAYEFGGAFDTPTPPPPLLLPKADAAEDSPPTTQSELGSDASLEIDSLAEGALPKDDEERTSATTKARSPAFKVSEQTSGVAGETMEEPILADDELLLYYKDLKKGGGSEAGAEVTAAGRPAPSPRHHGPTGDAFLPVVGGTINLEGLQPAPSATAVSREQGAEPDVSDTGKSSGSKLGATNAAFNRSTAISLDYYYKPYYISDIRIPKDCFICPSFPTPSSSRRYLSKGCCEKLEENPSRREESDPVCNGVVEEIEFPIENFLQKC